MALFNIFRRKQQENTADCNKQQKIDNSRKNSYSEDSKKSSRIWASNKNSCSTVTSDCFLLDENQAWSRSETCTLPDLRLVVFRENEWKDRRLLYDSDVFNFNLQQQQQQSEKINATKTNSLPAFSSSSRDFYVSNSPDSTTNTQKSLPTCVVEAEEASSSSSTSGGNKIHSDVKLIGETIFGSVSMSYKGDTIKLHQFSNPPRVMLTHVFHLPVKRRKSLQPIIRENFVFETDKNQAISNSSNKHRYHTNTAADISAATAMTSSSLFNRPTVIQNSNESDSDSQYSTVNSLENFLSTAAHHKRSGNIKIPHGSHMTCGLRLNPNTATPSPEDGGGSQSSAGGQGGVNDYHMSTPSTSTPITASWKSLQLTNLLSHSFENVVHQRRHSQPLIAENDINTNRIVRKRAQIGLAVLFTFNDENSADPVSLRNSRRFRRFLFSHIQLIELELLHLQREISNHCSKKQEFLIAASKAWSQFCLSLRILFESPRLARPVWQHFTGALDQNADCCCHNRKDSGIDTCDRTQNSLFSKNLDDNANLVDFETTFVNVLNALVEHLDRKETKFFLSTALTAFLSNHSGWVSSVAPPSFWPSRDQLNSIDSSNSSANPPDFLSSTSPRLPKKVNCCDVGCQTVNPFLAQLLDIWSVFNSERHSLRTFFVGRDSNLLLQLVFLFSYFLRCNNLKRLRFDQAYQYHYNNNRNQCNHNQEQQQPINDKLHNQQQLQPISDEHGPSCLSSVSIKEFMTESVLNDCASGSDGCFRLDVEVCDRLFQINDSSPIPAVNMDCSDNSDDRTGQCDKNSGFVLPLSLSQQQHCSKMHVDSYDYADCGSLLHSQEGAFLPPLIAEEMTPLSSSLAVIASTSHDQCPLCEHQCLMGGEFNEMLQNSQCAALFKSAPATVITLPFASTADNNNTISLSDSERFMYQRLFKSTIIETFVDKSTDNTDSVVSGRIPCNANQSSNNFTRCRPWTIDNADNNDDSFNDRLKVSTDIVDNVNFSSATTVSSSPYHQRHRSRRCEDQCDDEDRYENPGLSLQTCLQSSDKLVINPNFALSAFLITATTNDKNLDKRGNGNHTNNAINQSKRSNANGFITTTAAAGMERPIREALIKAALYDSSTSCISAVDFLLANTNDWSVKLLTCDSTNVSNAADTLNPLMTSSIDSSHVISDQSLPSASTINQGGGAIAPSASTDLRISEQTCLPSRAVLDLLENIKSLKSIGCEPEFILMYIEDFLSDVYRKGSSLATLLEESDCTRLDVAQLIGADQSDAALLLSVCSF